MKGSSPSTMAALRSLSPSEFVQTGLSFLWTRLFFRNATLIRRPFYLRGEKKRFSIGPGFTAGRFSRIEIFGNGVIEIGSSCHIGDYNHLVSSGSLRIGDGCLLASKIFISDTSHGSYEKNGSSPDVPPNDRPLVSSYVEIGNNVWIGENVVVLPGVTIGDGCVIGANSTVSRDVPPYSIVVGSPATPIKKYEFLQAEWKRTWAAS